MNPNHLQARIKEVGELVTRDMLQHVWQGLEYQLDICRVMNGAYVETY
jgi:hypothetical protein